MSLLVFKADHAVVALGDLAGDILFKLGGFLIRLEAQFTGCVRNTDTNLHAPSVRQSVLGFSLKAMATPTPSIQSLIEAGTTRPHIILGAPGSGKTSLLIARAQHLVATGYHPDSIRLLTPSRAQATALRDEVGIGLGAATHGATVMSVQAFAFSLVRADQERRGLEPTTLRSGADVDQDIRGLLEEHQSSGSGPQWPTYLNEAVRAAEAFRTELRELIARLTEWGLGAEDLRVWADVHPAWLAVAGFLDDYQRVIARSRPDQFDAAELLRVATSLIAEQPSATQSLSAVLIDDVQDLSPAAGDFIDALSQRGVHLSITADPDVAGQTFRGADPEGPARVAERLGVTPVVLSEVHRHGPSIREAVSSITARIGTARAGSQRAAGSTASDQSSPLRVLTAPSASREAHDIARLLLNRHRDDQVAFSDMAVVTRRAADIALLASRLQQAGVPTHQDYRVGLAEHPASRELVGWILAARQPGFLTPESAKSLLEGVYGQFEPTTLRRLGSYLRVLDQKNGTLRRGIESVVEVLAEGDYPPELPASMHRDLDRVIRVLRALRELPADSSAALVVSSVWNAWRVEDQWVARASDPTRPSLFHREALAQVSALLATAERYAERHPGVSPGAFFAKVLDNDITEDVVLPAAARTGVLIATPAAIAGQQFDTVVVHGVNDHVWPNTRIRWSLLGAPLVSRAVRGQLDDAVDDQRLVLDDELRMAALAVSRATSQVVVTAVSSEESGPSPLYRLLAEQAEVIESDPGALGSSRELVAHSRRALVAGDSRALDALRHSVTRGLAGAHPDSWWGVRPATTEKRIYDQGDIPLSPSTLGALEVSPLDWFLDRVAPDEATAALGIGSLVHHALEHQPWGSEEELNALVEARFGELDFESAWVGRAQAAKARGFVAALASYLRERQREGVEVVGVEQGFVVRIDRVEMRGLVDRIEQQSDGTLVVVDLKTGRAITSADEIADHPQLQAYQYALADADTKAQWGVEGDPAGAWLLFVSQGVGGKPFRVARQDALDATGLEMFATRVRSAAEVAAQAQFAGPRHYPMGGSNVSRHRWQRVGSVCGD